MSNIRIDGKGSDTIVQIDRPGWSGWVWDEGHIDHDSMGKLIEQWFKDAPKDVTLLLIHKLWLSIQK